VWVGVGQHEGMSDCVKLAVYFGAKVDGLRRSVNVDVEMWTVTSGWTGPCVQEGWVDGLTQLK